MVNLNGCIGIKPKPYSPNTMVMADSNPTFTIMLVLSLLDTF